MWTNDITALSGFHRISSGLRVVVSVFPGNISPQSFQHRWAAHHSRCSPNRDVSPARAARRPARSRLCSWWSPWPWCSARPPSAPSCCARWPAPGSGSRRRTWPWRWTRERAKRGRQGPGWKVEGRNLHIFFLDQICGPLWNGVMQGSPSMQFSTDSIRDQVKSNKSKCSQNKSTHLLQNKTNQTKPNNGFDFFRALLLQKPASRVKWNQFYSNLHRPKGAGGAEGRVGRRAGREAKTVE